MKYLAMILICQSALAQFQIGDSVVVGTQAEDCTNAHTLATILSPSLRCEPVGAPGKVIAGPASDAGIVFYQVSFTDGITGWAVGDNLTLVGTSPVPIQVPVFASLSATPSSLSTGGGTVKLRWNVLYAQSVGLAGVSGALGFNDSLITGVAYSQTFTFIATNSVGAATKSITVSVMEPPPIVLGFVIGGRVQTTALLNVRSVPSLTGNYPIATEVNGAQGTLVAGPTVAGDTWWKIQYDNGKLGWSAQAYLISVGTLPPPTYPSMADLYDTLVIASQGYTDPILNYAFHVRMGCADTTMSLPLLTFTTTNPTGYKDTTYFIGTYHFWKPKNSVER